MIADESFDVNAQLDILEAELADLRKDLKAKMSSFDGPAGPTGPMGATGPTGLRGNTGQQGDTGPQGRQGDPGIGEQGERGETGDSPEGPPGDTGPRGDIGPTGPQGGRGARGGTPSHPSRRGFYHAHKWAVLSSPSKSAGEILSKPAFRIGDVSIKAVNASVTGAAVSSSGLSIDLSIGTLSAGIFSESLAVASFTNEATDVNSWMVGNGISVAFSKLAAALSKNSPSEDEASVSENDSAALRDD